MIRVSFENLIILLRFLCYGKHKLDSIVAVDACRHCAGYTSRDMFLLTQVISYFSIAIGSLIYAWHQLQTYLKCLFCIYDIFSSYYKILPCSRLKGEIERDRAAKIYNKRQRVRWLGQRTCCFRKDKMQIKVLCSLGDMRN